MANTPKEMQEHKKALESRFIDMAQKEMDELLMTSNERKDMARQVVEAAEKKIKTPDKSSLSRAFNQQAAKEIKALQEIAKEVDDLVNNGPPPKAHAKRAPATTR